MAKHRMPKTRAEFEEALIYAFQEGCVFGYGVEHTVDMNEQEKLGAEHYVGRMSDEEYDDRIIALRGY